MDLEKLNLIKQFVLKAENKPKEYSDEFAGVYLVSNRPFNLYEDLAPNHAFRAFSQKEYPIYFFISPDAINHEFENFLTVYKNIKVVQIPKLRSIYEFNNFSINSLLYSIEDKHENLFFYQNDGFAIKSGFEYVAQKYSWIGSKWKEPIRVIENTFNFPAFQVGNGGANFRTRSKCLKVLDLINKHGGQDKIVKGLSIGGKTRTEGWFLAEDAIFCHFGFGSGIFEPVSNEEADKFALEPIPYELAVGDKEYRPFFYHRVDY